MLRLSSAKFVHPVYLRHPPSVVFGIDTMMQYSFCFKKQSVIKWMDFHEILYTEFTEKPANKTKYF